MDIDRVECTGTFQINEGYWFKAFWGGQITPEEDPETETLKLKDRLEEMAKKFGVLKTIPIAEALPVETKESKIDGIAEAIKSCTTLKALERFAPMVERENVGILYEAYHNKKKQLDGTSKLG